MGLTSRVFLCPHKFLLCKTKGIDIMVHLDFKFALGRQGIEKRGSGPFPC